MSTFIGYAFLIFGGVNAMLPNCRDTQTITFGEIQTYPSDDLHISADARLNMTIFAYDNGSYDPHPQYTWTLVDAFNISVPLSDEKTEHSEYINCGTYTLSYAFITMGLEQYPTMFGKTAKLNISRSFSDGSDTVITKNNLIFQDNWSLCKISSFVIGSDKIGLKCIHHMKDLPKVQFFEEENGTDLNIDDTTCMTGVINDYSVKCRNGSVSLLKTVNKQTTQIWKCCHILHENICTQNLAVSPKDIEDTTQILRTEQERKDGWIEVFCAAIKPFCPFDSAVFSIVHIIENKLIKVYEESDHIFIYERDHQAFGQYFCQVTMEGRSLNGSLESVTPHIPPILADSVPKVFDISSNITIPFFSVENLTLNNISLRHLVTNSTETLDDMNVMTFTVNLSFFGRRCDIPGQAFIWRPSSHNTRKAGFYIMGLSNSYGDTVLNFSVIEMQENIAAATPPTKMQISLIAGCLFGILMAISAALFIVRRVRRRYSDEQTANQRRAWTTILAVESDLYLGVRRQSTSINRELQVPENSIQNTIYYHTRDIANTDGMV